MIITLHGGFIITLHGSSDLDEQFERTDNLKLVKANAMPFGVINFVNKNHLKLALLLT